MTTILRRGSSGPEVRQLQETLNQRMSPSPNLTVNGQFDDMTENAVWEFQTLNWLPVDGIAGPLTRNALFGLETFTPILHDVPYYAQPTSHTCWAAATAMIKHCSVSMIRFSTPLGLLNANGALINGSEAFDGTGVHRRYANLHRLSYRGRSSMSVEGILNLLGRGPMMVEYLHNLSTFRRGLGSDSHWIVYIGARGTMRGDGSETVFRIYDPAGTGGDQMVSLTYRHMLQHSMAATYTIFTA